MIMSSQWFCSMGAAWSASNIFGLQSPAARVSSCVQGKCCLHDCSKLLRSAAAPPSSEPRCNGSRPTVQSILAAAAAGSWYVASRQRVPSTFCRCRQQQDQRQKCCTPRMVAARAHKLDEIDEIEQLLGNGLYDAALNAVNQCGGSQKAAVLRASTCRSAILRRGT